MRLSIFQDALRRRRFLAGALAAALLAACGCQFFYREDGMSGATKRNWKASQEKESAAAPRALIIGDSISIGYTPFVKEMLADEAEVFHNPGNAQSTRHGVEQIDEWLGDGDWDVIVLNHGLHDLKFVDENFKNTRDVENGRRQVAVEDYEANLDTIARRLQETDAALFFATTTPFPDQPDGPLRYAADVDRYNAAALRVMDRHDITVIDLHGAVKDRLGELQQPNNVHFTRDGSRFLAEQVVAAVRKAIADEG